MMPWHFPAVSPALFRRDLLPLHCPFEEREDCIPEIPTIVGQVILNPRRNLGERLTAHKPLPLQDSQCIGEGLRANSCKLL